MEDDFGELEERAQDIIKKMKEDTRYLLGPFETTILLRYLLKRLPEEY